MSFLQSQKCAYVYYNQHHSFNFLLKYAKAAILYYISVSVSAHLYLDKVEKRWGNSCCIYQDLHILILNLNSI